MVRFIFIFIVQKEEKVPQEKYQEWQYLPNQLYFGNYKQVLPNINGYWHMYACHQFLQYFLL